jgi:hypothetical protein
MKVLLIAFFELTVAAVPAQQTFTGTITDSMCLLNHKMMNITPEEKCARECVKTSRSVRWVLYDGKNAYRLSDQKTPEKFAAKRAKVTGQLFPKTGVIKVDRIEALP